MITYPIVIAEVGSNWTNLQDCLKSIESAHECGADAVKFQLFTAKSLYGPKSKAKVHSLPREWVSKLKEHADKVGIDFMCTAFSRAEYEFIDPYVKIHKLASCELADADLVQYVIWFGKKVLLSTGGYTLDQLFELFSNLKIIQAYPPVLMACELDYDHASHETLFRKYLLLKSNFPNFELGISDHTKLAYSGCIDGIRYIEKHFAYKEMNTPDFDHSLMPFQMKRYITHNKPDLLTSEEKVNALKWHRQVVAILDIKKGSAFTETNIDIYRPSIEPKKYVSALKFKDLLSKQATKNYKAGEVIDQ